MVVRNFKELLHRSEPTVPVRIGSAYPVQVPEIWFQMNPFSNPAENIAEAQREGMRPLNYKQLCEQLSLEQLQNAVLFDTPPRGVEQGNHWRVLGVRNGPEKRDHVKLQLVSGGGIDEKRFPPVTVSQYDILFTGINIMQHQRGKDPIHMMLINLASLNERLDEVNTGKKTFAYPDDVKLMKQTIYFADSKGKLLTTDKHPLFPKNHY